MFFYLPFVWYEDRKGRERKEETQEREMYILFACPLKYVILSLTCFFFLDKKKKIISYLSSTLESYEIK